MRCERVAAPPLRGKSAIAHPAHYGFIPSLPVRVVTHGGRLALLSIGDAHATEIFQMNRTLLALLLALPAAVAQAQIAQAQVAPGSYFMENGGGILKVSPGKFDIQSGGAPGVCNIEGKLKGMNGRADDEDVCLVTFRARDGGYEVIARTKKTCRSYCGEHADFAGLYRKPAAGCADSERKKTRGEFRAAYDAKDYAKAQTIVSGQLKNCAKTLQPIETAGIRSDLAITLFHLGRKDECLAVLKPLAEEAAMSDDDAMRNYTGAEWETYKVYLNSARQNLKLCKG